MSGTLRGTGGGPFPLGVIMEACDPLLSFGWCAINRSFELKENRTMEGLALLQETLTWFHLRFCFSMLPDPVEDDVDHSSIRL